MKNHLFKGLATLSNQQLILFAIPVKDFHVRLCGIHNVKLAFSFNRSTEQGY
jgi:hypothetical protein